MNIYVVFNRRCNLTCSFCYENPTGIKTGACTDPQGLLTFQKFLSDRPQIQSLTILGGEAFLDQDSLHSFLTFINDLPNRNLKVMFITNGTIYLPWLKDYKDIIKTVQISLDGGPEAQDLYRIFPNKEGSYTLVIENLKKYMEDGLNVTAHGVISWDSRKLFKKSFPQLMRDLPKNVFYNLEPAHGSDGNIFHALIISNMVYSLFKKYKDHSFNTIRNVGMPRVQPGNFCTAGTSFIAFDINSGKFYGCHEYTGVDTNLIGDIKNDAPIDATKVDEFVRRRDVNNYKIKGIPKWLSKLILISFPIFICWSENKELTGSYYLISWKTVIIYFVSLIRGKEYILQRQRRQYNENKNTH